MPTDAIYFTRDAPPSIPGLSHSRVGSESAKWFGIRDLCFGQKHPRGRIHVLHHYAILFQLISLVKKAFKKNSQQQGRQLTFRASLIISLCRASLAF
jgi:hypothetical protein